MAVKKKKSNMRDIWIVKNPLNRDMVVPYNSAHGDPDTVIPAKGEVEALRPLAEHCAKYICDEIIKQKFSVNELYDEEKRAAIYAEILVEKRTLKTDKVTSTPTKSESKNTGGKNKNKGKEPEKIEDNGTPEVNPEREARKQELEALNDEELRMQADERGVLPENEVPREELVEAILGLEFPE